jgi:hypothetical protein
MRFPFFFVSAAPLPPRGKPEIAGAEAAQLVHAIGETQIWCAMAADGRAQMVYDALSTAAHRWTRRELLLEPWLCELVRKGIPWVIAGDDQAQLARLDYDVKTGEVFDAPDLETP